jgi:hypothetical protein
LALNYATSGDKEPYFTRLITNTYNKYAGAWAHRNNIHTEMIEEAAADRVLFLNEASQSVRHVDLRFPEYVSFLACRADMMECVARNKQQTSWMEALNPWEPPC